MQRLEQGTVLAGKGCESVVVAECCIRGFDVGRNRYTHRCAGGECRGQRACVVDTGGSGEKPEEDEAERTLVFFGQQMQAVAVKDTPQHGGRQARTGASRYE
jgi:hypothetical protein